MSHRSAEGRGSHSAYPAHRLLVRTRAAGAVCGNAEILAADTTKRATLGSKLIPAGFANR
jgi:hypothetical protein